MKPIHAELALVCMTALLAYGCSTAPTAQSVMTTAQAAAAMATTPVKIDNFMLVDTDMEAHELYRLADATAVVIVTQANGDAVVRGQATALKALKTVYGAKGVEFLMLNSNLKDSREAIQAEAAKAGFDTPILMDANQLVGESLGVTRSAELLIVNPKTWTVAYRGAMSGAAKALEALSAGQPVALSAGPASAGAAIAFPERAATKISYAKDVAPILEAKCVACHEKGGIGPFAMDGYNMVKGFAPMIREVIRTQRMPPYGADPHVGQFSDGKSLSPAQVKTIVHWVEAGAPRGDGADPLAAAKLEAQDWPLGKPDVVLNVPAFTIPASGAVDYQRPFVVNPSTEGRWLKASTIKAGSRQGVHHILTGFYDVVPDGHGAEGQWGESVGSYAVGSESEIAPKDVGTWVPGGGAIGFQMHYTPFGKEVLDKSQIGLYFYKPGEIPKLVMHNDVIMNPNISIPPNDSHYVETAYLEFAHDALLYSAFPHAHYRAASSDLWIQYPDGKMKELLALPRYDFNWQRAYNFAAPIRVPAGSKLVAHYVYDNSRRNPHNPDPSKNVVWGEQSWEEMFYTRLRFRWVDETSAKLTNYSKDFEGVRLLGLLDTDLDGKVEKSELRGKYGVMIARFWALLDTNHDGVLDKTEVNAGQVKLREQERQADAAKRAATTAKPAPGA